MSNPKQPPSPRPEALKKLAQLQIERLKKEEEEEQWISGEELCTEGSSDEDDVALRMKKRANEGKCAKKTTTKGNACKEKKLHLKQKLTSESTNVSLVPGVPFKESQLQNLTLSEEIPTCDKLPAEHDEENAGISFLSDVNEEPIEISWRPKRGSIKLPNLSTEGCSKRKSNYNECISDSLEDATKSYQKVLKKVSKLKNYICDDRAYSTGESSAVDLADNRTLEELAQEFHVLHSEPLESTVWNSEREADDALQTAYAKMNRLDALLKVIEAREKESRQETLHLQLDFRRQLEKIYSPDNTNVNVNSALFRNTAAFYQLCPLVRKKVKEEAGEGGWDRFPCVLRENVQINLDANNNDAEQTDKEEWNEKEDLVPDLHSTDEDAASVDEEEDNKKELKTTKKKLPHFILRNIKLASEGMGTLSITDEEKERLAKLLKDIDLEIEGKGRADASKDNDGNGDNGETEFIRNEDQYGGYLMDPEMEQSLKEIDSKLEILSLNGSLSDEATHPSLNINNNQEPVGNENQDDKRRGWKESRIKKRLHEIDQSLLNFTQPIEEPVEPMRENDLQKLIEELSSPCSSSTPRPSETSSETADVPPLPPPAAVPELQRERTFDTIATYGSKGSELRDDFTATPTSSIEPIASSSESSDQVSRWPYQLKSEVVQQLVEQAKAHMPHFKFRYAD